MKLMKIIFTLLLLMPISASADTNTENNNIDKNLALEIQKYINNLNNLKGEFKQRSSTGDIDFGNFYISRPGRMKLEYSVAPVLLVANNDEMLFVDTELGQISQIDPNTNPAGIILRKNVDFFNSDLKVLDTNETIGKAEITLAIDNNLGAGYITFKFLKSPMELISWEVHDAQGNITNVELESVKTGIELASSLFRLKDISKYNRISY